MDDLKHLHWPLILGLGALALVRPLMSVVGLMDAIGKPTGPLLVTVAISAAWVLAVGLSRVARPVLTLVLAGVIYGALSMLLSAVLSPVLTGELQGPLANPIAIGPVLLINAVWGALAGALALGIQRVLGRREAS